MEHRIGSLKKLIGNLGGPNFDQQHVQLVNRTVDIKEELHYRARVSHGVKIRSGAHNARDDNADYRASLNFLEENRAHIRVEGRAFGDYDLPEDIMEHFDQAQFYCWIASKNAEVMQTLHQ